MEKKKLPTEAKWLKGIITLSETTLCPGNRGLIPQESQTDLLQKAAGTQPM